MAADTPPCVLSYDAAAALAAGQALHVAPMLAVTDRHFRQLCRLLSARAVLWSEMVHADAVLHNHGVMLPFDAAQRPCVLQLGGAAPELLARAAAIGAAEYGYTEVNLNCGCPSSKVCHKRDAAMCFGARLMTDPEHTGECLRRMAEAVDVPVSVKCRMGVDDAAEYSDLVRFVEGVTDASGVRRVTVHARAALLGGISPAANRRVPPLRHDAVHRLKADFPRLAVTLNGGVETLAAAAQHLAAGLDGVMMGRAVQRNPLLLADVDSELFGDAPRGGDADVAAALRGYARYVDASVAAAEQAVAPGRGRLRQRAEKPLALPAVAREMRRLGLLPPPPREQQLQRGDTAAEQGAPCEEAEE